MPFKIDGGPAGIWTRVLRLRRCGGTVRGGYYWVSAKFL